MAASTPATQSSTASLVTLPTANSPPNIILGAQQSTVPDPPISDSTTTSPPILPAQDQSRVIVVDLDRMYNPNVITLEKPSLVVSGVFSYNGSDNKTYIVNYQDTVRGV